MVWVDNSIRVIIWPFEVVEVQRERLREDVHQGQWLEVGTGAIVTCIVHKPISGEILTVQGSPDLFHPHKTTYIKEYLINS